MLINVKYINELFVKLGKIVIDVIVKKVVFELILKIWGEVNGFFVIFCIRIFVIVKFFLIIIDIIVFGNFIVWMIKFFFVLFVINIVFIIVFKFKFIDLI